MRIVMRRVDELHPYPGNPRRNDAAVDRVAASIREFGFRQPIVVGRDGVIVIGHTRWKAAQLLGLKQVPVHVADGLSEAKLRALRIADNRLQDIAEWDNDLLAGELAELKALGADLGLLGFSADELTELAGLAEGGGLTDPDAVPEPPTEVVARPGDLIVLGDHRLLCGDSTRAEDVERLMDGRSTYAIVYDPPWDADVQPPARADLAFSDGYRCGDAIRHFGPPAWVFVWDCVTSWYTPNRPLRRMKLCLWYGDLTDYDFNGAHYGEAGEERHVENTRGDYQFRPDPRGKHLSDVYASPITKRTGAHPHEKPCDWVRMLIGNCTEGDVYDPFLGSGTTLIAAEQLGRRCFGMEIAPVYCDVIVRRWEQFTGRKARRPKRRM